jgi:hypothetical protein
VQLNDTPMSTIQAALDASTQAADVVKVSGYCQAHDLSLTKNLTLQGGWSVDFGDQDPAVHTTTLDGQSLGRVLLVDGGVSPTIDGFTITGGETSDNGGGISINSGSPLVQNNTFMGNVARTGAGLYNESGNPTIQNNTFTGNSASGMGTGYSGGGLANNTGSPTILGNTFTGNSAEDRGGGLYNISGSPTIRNNTFSDNSVHNSDWEGDGGGLCSDYGNPTIQGNLFDSNDAEEGGGMYIAYESPLIQNNIFSGNVALTAGGGFYNEGGSPTIWNNTFIGNSADYGGGLYNGSYEFPDLRSNIVAGNTAATGGGIYDSGYGPSAVDYNDVWNNTNGGYVNVTPGAHDISADPRLVDPDAGDFHLAADSPCIDAGDPANYPPTDFEGEARPNGAAPDIGADEYYVRMN